MSLHWNLTPWKQKQNTQHLNPCPPRSRHAIILYHMNTWINESHIKNRVAWYSKFLSCTHLLLLLLPSRERSPKVYTSPEPTCLQQVRPPGAAPPSWRRACFWPRFLSTSAFSFLHPTAQSSGLISHPQLVRFIFQKKAKLFICVNSALGTHKLTERKQSHILSFQNGPSALLQEDLPPQNQALPILLSNRVFAKVIFPD